jgi:thiol:disulfide interchange protein DsbD
MTGGKLLPKAGNWMNVVKTGFGFMMLVVAMLFVERMVDNQWTQLAWGLLGLSAFTYFYLTNQDTPNSFWKGVRTLVVFVGLFFSFTYGYEAFSPKVTVSQAGSEHAKPEFIKVTDLADFEVKLSQASADGKSIMLDLYADWCVACKEFEEYTFSDPAVIDALSETIWMQIDLTELTDSNTAFQEHYAILGLPTIMFFDETGKELETGRVTGFLKAEPFANHVNGLLNN